jgi:hypothetical protein
MISTYNTKLAASWLELHETANIEVKLVPDQQVYIIGAFAAALQRREFSKPDEKCLVVSTVQKTMAKLGKMFRSNWGITPHMDTDVNHYIHYLPGSFKECIT